MGGTNVDWNAEVGLTIMRSYQEIPPAPSSGTPLLLPGSRGRSLSADGRR